MPQSNAPSKTFLSYRSSQADYTTSIDAYQAQAAQSNNMRPSSQEMAVASVGVLLLVTVWYVVRRNLRHRKAHEESFGGHSSQPSQAKGLTSHLPCTQCHYFKANIYLPCAVNPTVALKPEAQDCGDFRPRSGHESTTVVG